MTAERQFLDVVQGGCQAPIGVFALALGVGLITGIDIAGLEVRMDLAYRVDDTDDAHQHHEAR